MYVGPRLEVAVLGVSRPRWTRLNIYAETPDSPASQPLTDTILALRRLFGPAPLKPARLAVEVTFENHVHG